MTLFYLDVAKLLACWVIYYLSCDKMQFWQRHGMGEASKNKLKDTSVIFQMTNVTILGLFRTHARKECGKVLEMRSTPILNILALLFF